MIADCKLVDLPSFCDERGALTFLESGVQIPFAIERVYYLYEVPKSAERGYHAHKALHQLVVAMTGSFEIILDDGFQRVKFHLNRPDVGLYICPMIWRELKKFSRSATCIVFASQKYSEDDYFRNYDSFLSEVKRK